MAQLRLIPTKWIFILTLISIGVTSLIVYISGIDIQRTLLENTLISLSILSLAFFLFVTFSLYFGVKLKDNLGSVARTNAEKGTLLEYLPDPDSKSSAAEWFTGFSGISVGDGIGGIIASIVASIVFAILIIALLFFFEWVIITFVYLFIAMLYWIFYRALRLIFKYSSTCKNDLAKSILYGLIFTVFYSFWIYGIVFAIDLMRA